MVASFFVLTLFMCTDPNVSQCPVEKEPVEVIPFNRYDDCVAYGKASVKANKQLSGYQCTRHE